MEFRVLGSLEVVEEGRPRRVGGPKTHALLAIFLTRPGRVIAADELMEELWEGNPPDTAANALRVHVTNLRAALEPNRPRTSPSVRIPATSPGYRLSIEPDELDAQRFERLVVVAREEAAQTRLAEAAEVFEQALGLWRGPAFADTRDLRCIQAEAARLEELRASAFEDLMEVRLALGEHGAIVGRLEAAVTEHPLRERLTGQLMLALYRSGRQAEALRAFTQLRVTLGDELGIEPATEIRALEEAILLQHSELGWTAPAVATPRTAGPRARNRGLFVGRKRELYELEQIFGDMEAGATRTVFVSGPPGIGKTSLARALGDEARSAGAIVLDGRCDAEPIGPYQPFVEAIRAYVRRPPASALDAMPDPISSELARLVPELSGRLGPRPGHEVDVETDRYRLFEAVAALFAQEASPVVLVLDDLHWADGSTLLLIRHLARHPDIGALMMLCTFRDSDVGPAHPLTETLSRLGAEGLVDRVELTGLEPDDVEAFVRARASAETLAGLLPHVDVVHQLTGGNPFFVKEVIQHFDETDVEITGPEAVGSLAPKGAQDLLAQRLARLTPPASAALRVASVIGQEFNLDLLARACKLDEEAMLEAVEEALGNRLVEEHADFVDRYAFTHAVVRNAVYAALSASRRVRLHRQVGEALEELVGDQRADRLMELAHHFCEAAPTGVAPKAARYAIAAGDAAVESVAYEDAVDHYRRALALGERAELDDESHGRTLLMMGRALEGAGSREDATRAYLEAADVGRRLNDGSLLTDVCLAFAGPWQTNRGEFSRILVSLLEDALERVGTDLRRRTQLLDLKAGALYYAGPSADEQAVAEEALRLGRQLEDPIARGAGLGAWYRFLSHGSERAHERLALSRELVEIADGFGMEEQLLAGRRRLLCDLLEVGEIQEFDRALEDYAQLANRRGHPGHLWSAGVFRATRVSLGGDLNCAERLNAEALELGQRIEQKDALGAYLLQTFVLRYQQGRLGEVAPSVESPIEDEAYAPVWYALLATLFAETDRRDDAVRIIARLAGQDFHVMPRDQFWLAGIALLAGAAATCRATDHTGPLRDLLEPHAESVIVFGVGGAFLGTGHFWLGTLDVAEGRWEDAQRHLGHALEALEAMGAAFWVARTKLELAGALSKGPTTNHHTEVERLVSQTLAYAKREGSGRLVDGCEAVLADIGRKPEDRA